MGKGDEKDGIYVLPLMNKNDDEITDPLKDFLMRLITNAVRGAIRIEKEGVSICREFLMAGEDRKLCLCG